MTVEERQALMPRGAQREIANSLGIAESYVSAVMTDDARPKTHRALRTVRRVQTAIAAKLELPVAQVFPDTEQETAPAMARAS